MSERDVYIKCIPQIAEMAIEVREMTAWEYLEFKQEYLEEVSKTCPKALGFVKKILASIEWCLSEC